MIRHLAYLAPIALLGLAACDGGPAALTKAKEGECYAVTGREPGGAPKWEKTECAIADAAVTAPIETADASGKTTAAGTAATTTAAGACPTAPVTCPTVTTAPRSPGSARLARSDREYRMARTPSRVSRSSSSAGSGNRDYVRAYTPDYPQQDLLGGVIERDQSNDSRSYSDNQAYSNGNGYDNGQAYAYNPPAPPVQRYERREEYSNGYGRHAPPPPAPRYLPPPPPPPVVYDDRAGHGGAYQSGGRSGHSAQYSSRESRSSTYSSSSSSHASGGYGCPSRCDERSVMAPMNGPHFPIDRDGFLTWRGKTR